MNNMYIDGDERVFFGQRANTSEKIWMTKPDYACGWYWSFGWMGNKNCHYHLDGYQSKDHYLELKDGTHKLITEHRNMNMYDCLREDYALSPHIDDNLWEFCEQVSTIYTLKASAEVLYRGGSHFTTHPLMKTIKANNHDDFLNLTLLPTLLQRFWDSFGDEKGMLPIKYLMPQ